MTDKKITIIGCGIIGSALALQLAKRGQKNITIIEKASSSGQGSTGASSACLRQRYTHDEVCKLAHEGLLAFQNWKEFTGLDDADCGYVKTGVLWIMGEQGEVLKNDAARLQKLGIDARVISKTVLNERYPALSSCDESFDLTGEVEHTCNEQSEFLWEPEGGYADPTASNQDLVRAAKALGCKVLFNEEVISVEKDLKKIESITTKNGLTIRTDILINAAGPWAEGLNKMVGFEHDWELTPTRIQVCVRDRNPEIKGEIPMFADISTGIYGRPEANGGQILFGSILEEDEQEIVTDLDNFDTSVDPNYRDSKHHGIHHRFEQCEGRGEIRGYSGLYCVNRVDMHPLVGATDVEGYYLITGFSGHGFKLAPSVSSLLAQEITGIKIDGDSEIVPSIFSVNRKPIHLDVKCVLA
jgi:sarcosine oxidase, subunit beta